MADVIMEDSRSEKLMLDAKAWPLESLQLFRKLLQNVMDNPHDAKFRKLKLTNARIGALLAESGARNAFEALGWIMSSTGDALELPATACLDLTAAVLRGTELQPPGEPVALTVLRGALKSNLGSSLLLLFFLLYASYTVSLSMVFYAWNSANS